jgi:uncharacterized protein YndB with AHSA1/START domain
VSEIRIVQEYPHPVGTVWRALTDPALVPRWTATGAGARPVGFAPEVGTRFQYVGKPKPGWAGIVDCELLELDPPRLLRFSWTDHGGGPTTDVAFRLESIPAGTRLSFRHTGFSGVGGRFMAAFLGRVRRRMLAEGLPPLLAELDGAAAPASGLG